MCSDEEGDISDKPLFNGTRVRFSRPAGIDEFRCCKSGGQVTIVETKCTHRAMFLAEAHCIHPSVKVIAAENLF